MLKVTSTTTLSFYKTDGFTVDTVALLLLRIFFQYVHSLFRENNHLEFPTLFYFFLFFCSFFLFIF